jgi:hypothetical protein
MAISAKWKMKIYVALYNNTGKARLVQVSCIPIDDERKWQLFDMPEHVNILIVDDREQQERKDKYIAISSQALHEKRDFYQRQYNVNRSQVSYAIFSMLREICDKMSPLLSHLDTLD